MTEAPPAVAGLLLTGGRSSRLGRDKARLPVDGIPNAQRLADAMRAALDGPVLEVGPGHTSLPTAPEDRPGEGPLAAIAAGARALRAAGHHGPAVVLACDLPLADEELVAFLAAQPGTTIPVVDGRPQPLCARYDGPALDAAPRLVANGARAVNALLDIVPVRLLDGVDPRGFLDVDTPEDLARAEVVRRPTTSVPVLAVGGAERPDTLVTEEPLELRVGGPDGDFATVNVTMRTPGHDFELAVGWLLAEGVVESADDVAAVRYCALGEDEPQRYNVVSVRLARRDLSLKSVARTTLTTASCGVCGTATLDRLAEMLGDEPLPPSPSPIPVDTLLALPDRLRAAQPLFDRTGGLHGAGLFRSTGELVAVREDVGRHNAVDKLVGHALLQRLLPLHDHVLVVSGRVSYELVQKAAVARIPVLCAVSAPSSLAVETAQRVGITLLGFVRDGTANVYSHPERITL